MSDFVDSKKGFCFLKIEFLRIKSLEKKGGQSHFSFSENLIYPNSLCCNPVAIPARKLVCWL
jgi:hypothetical protein